MPSIQLQTLADFPQGPFPVPGPEPGLLRTLPPGSPLDCRMPSWPPHAPPPPTPICSPLPPHQALPPHPHPLPPSLNTIYPALLLRGAPPGPDKCLPVGPLPLLGPRGLFSKWPDKPFTASGPAEPLWRSQGWAGTCKRGLPSHVSDAKALSTGLWHPRSARQS